MAGWTDADLAVLERALSTAPSVHDTMPWVVEAGSDRVDLFEWTDRPLTTAPTEPSSESSPRGQVLGARMLREAPP
ncbi:hypothetical protein SAMN06265360_12128 [Haloechinothrix alba]|uniref:Nitroreductase n=1 Tax=Haloechinothrix alba TaxID=664784 RepID=A0A238ZFZ5_9PSEU|nr:hypothetical protein [Haloechinothrix alba]SNR82042.1 hypothetical protein SAMN06265360_12128 [Haloechinothrix alba]